MTLFQRLALVARVRGFALAPALADELARRCAQAEAATPGLRCDPAPYCEQLVSQLADAPDALLALKMLHVEDMYLAHALALGDRAAFARFERELLGPLVGQVAANQQEIRGEIEQQVRTRLFVARAGTPARIQLYQGRGPLAAWVRMVGKRVALDLWRARGHEASLGELDSPSVATDPELDYLKLRYAGDFKLALEGALRALDARQVTLLKLTFIEQVPATSIGVMYGVSSRTVQRWVAELRETVLVRTREGLRARFRLSPAELDSLLGLMQSQLHVTLQRVLNLDE